MQKKQNYRIMVGFSSRKVATKSTLSICAIFRFSKHEPFSQNTRNTEKPVLVLFIVSDLCFIQFSFAARVCLSVALEEHRFAIVYESLPVTQYTIFVITTNNCYPRNNLLAFLELPKETNEAQSKEIKQAQASTKKANLCF